MTSYLAGLVNETAPGLTLALAALLGSFPPYVIVTRSARGRARSAIGYLLGLGAGIAATVAMAVAVGPNADTSAIAAAGLLAAFFAPFAGLVRGKWHGVRRPARRRPAAEVPH